MKIEYKVIAASLIAGLMIWVVDAVVDSRVFGEGPLSDMLLLDVPTHALAHRSVAIACFLLLGIVVSRVFAMRRHVEEALRKSEAQLRALAFRLTKVEEAERKTLAGELHDWVGQNLTALNIELNIIKNQLPHKSPDKIEAKLSETINLVEETTQRIRNVMASLRPEVLDDYGLMAALRWHSERFSNRTGIRVEIMGEELIPRLPLDTETTLFRIAQEAMTNVAKHAQAQSVTVSLKKQQKDVYLLTIADDGVGFNLKVTSNYERNHRWGLMTMRERAQSVGGQLRLESEPGKGTRVVVAVRR